jgi:hypothetical protein
MDQIVILSGRALVALVILIAGIMSAGWLAELGAREAEQAGLRGSSAFRRFVVHHIVAVSALLAAAQLGLETYVVVLLAVVVLATIGLVTALLSARASPSSPPTSRRAATSRTAPRSGT